MPARRSTSHLVVHTCADGRIRDGEHVDTPPEDVVAWHTAPKPRGRGWSRVGYHYLVRKSGGVHRLLDEKERGIHCRDGGMNSKALGVSFSGHGGDDYWDVDGEPWTAEQEAAGIELIADLCERWGIPVKNVIGHREAGAKKACPGDRIDMDRVRRLVANAIERRAGSARSPAPAPRRPVLGRGDDGGDVGEAQAVLKRLGIYRGRVDGDFGAQTDRAVRAFQRLRGLRADGIIGEATWAALEDAR